MVLLCSRVLVCVVSWLLWMVLYWWGRYWLSSVNGGGVVFSWVSMVW